MKKLIIAAFIAVSFGGCKVQPTTAVLAPISPMKELQAQRDWACASVTAFSVYETTFESFVIPKDCDGCVELSLAFAESKIAAVNAAANVLGGDTLSAIEIVERLERL